MPFIKIAKITHPVDDNLIESLLIDSEWFECPPAECDFLRDYVYKENQKTTRGLWGDASYEILVLLERVNPQDLLAHRAEFTENIRKAALREREMQEKLKKSAKLKKEERERKKLEKLKAKFEKVK